MIDRMKNVDKQSFHQSYSEFYKENAISYLCQPEKLFPTVKTQ